MNVTDEQVLKHCASVAHHTFKLTVWQWLPGPCSGHAPGSLHYQKFRDGVGRAFDAYGPSWRMGAFAIWLRARHGGRLTEAIYNGNVTKLSIKRGRKVPSTFWGLATWLAHKNHVHVGM